MAIKRFRFDGSLDIGYSSNALSVGASLGGGPVSVLGTPLSFTPASAPIQLRFRGAPQAFDGSVPNSEVVEFRWIGGDIDKEVALDNNTLPNAFSSLEFLLGP